MVIVGLYLGKEMYVVCFFHKRATRVKFTYMSELTPLQEINIE